MLGWLLLIIVLKFAVVALIVRLSGEAPAVALRAATTLAHGGEFGLLLVSLGLRQGIFEPAVAQPIFVALGISIFIAPLLMKRRDPVPAALARAS